MEELRLSTDTWAEGWGRSEYPGALCTDRVRVALRIEDAVVVGACIHGERKGMIIHSRLKNVSHGPRPINSELKVVVNEISHGMVRRFDRGKHGELAAMIASLPRSEDNWRLITIQSPASSVTECTCVSSSLAFASSSSPQMKLDKNDGSISVLADTS